MIFGNKHSEKKLGKKYYNAKTKKIEFFYDFKNGPFKKSDKVNFFTKKTIKQIFKKFKIFLTEKLIKRQLIIKK